ncbi:MAG: hypothetical protein V7691_02990 [Galbibacter orientalis]|uniref:hypothetical protein n=1 Tax=Galbibacter orientalis TaxID=453852 RepID=UPI0030025B8D
MNPILEYIKTQKPELAEFITVIDTLQTQDQEEATVLEDMQDEDAVELFDEESKVKPEAIQMKKLKSEILKLRQLVKVLKQEVYNESQLNHDLALAIGACKYCFGCDDDCNNCHGEGAPGFFVPDYIHYKELILPAIKKFNLHFNAKTNY